MSREQLPETFKPFQPLLDELSDPENRLPVPPLDKAFQRQLRAQLLGQQTVGLSRLAVGRLWQFAATAVLLLMLTVGIANLWLALSRQPDPAAVPVARPTATPSLAPTPTRIPTALSLGWETAVSFPLPVGDGLQIEAVTVENEGFVAGETAVLHLTWNATAIPTANYTSFIHVYDAGGTLIAQADVPLGATAEWQVPGPVTITYALELPFPALNPPYALFGLELPSSAPAAPYALFVGVYDAATGQRLQAAGTDGLVRLGQVVLPPEVATAQLIADCVGGQPTGNPFEPPYAYPDAVAASNLWLGSADLWTAVPPDYVWRGLPEENGRYGQKLVWWSQHFDIEREPNPALTVTGRRLDGNARPLRALPATNGFSADSGTFMLTGVEIPTAGCWEISGSYRGYTVSYLVWVEGR